MQRLLVFWSVLGVGLYGGLAKPIEDTSVLTFVTSIWPKDDLRCNATQRCLHIAPAPLKREGRAVYPSNTNTQHQQQQQHENKNFAVVQTVIEEHENMITIIMTQLIERWFANETFVLHTKVRRDSWSWSSAYHCMTQPTNSSVQFTTTCASTGYLSQSSSCFPNDARVTVRLPGDAYPKHHPRMDELATHYTMLTFVVENTTFNISPFMTMVHHEPLKIERFLVIELGSTQLMLTQRHLLYRFVEAADLNCSWWFNSSVCMELVFAEELHVQDVLFVLNTLGSALRLERISSITSELRQGVYSPMPSEPHAFFVNHVLVSPFSETKDPFWHMLHYAYACVVAELEF